MSESSSSRVSIHSRVEEKNRVWCRVWNKLAINYVKSRAKVTNSEILESFCPQHTGTLRVMSARERPRLNDDKRKNTEYILEKHFFFHSKFSFFTRPRLPVKSAIKAKFKRGGGGGIMSLKKLFSVNLLFLCLS